MAFSAQSIESREKRAGETGPRTGPGPRHHLSLAGGVFGHTRLRPGSAGSPLWSLYVPLRSGRSGR